MRRTSRARVGVVCLLAAALLAPAAEAEPDDAPTTARIEGVVRDAAGTPLAGVTVVASSPALSGTRATITDGDGRFALTDLPPGTYDVTCYYADLTVRRKSVTASAGAPATIAVELDTADAGGEVITISDAPMIDPARNIPVPGRTFESTLGTAGGVSASGSTSVENHYVVDGVNTSGLASGSARQHSAPRARLLTAATVADHDRFGAYVDFQDRHDDTHDQLGLALRRRLRVEVVDAAGRPVHDAAITVSTSANVRARGRTHADGIWDFFPDVTGARRGELALEIAHAGARETITTRLPARGVTRTERVVLDVQGAAPAALDLAFAIDATGSMSDEMRYLTTELRDIVAAVRDAAPGVSIRVGAVLYRDRSDDVPLVQSDFTGDVDAFVAELGEIVASGGGDYPEDMNRGLRAAMRELAWRDGNTVRVLVLLADAPPQDYASQYTYADALVEASARGIRILPVAASGADRTVEALFRALGAATSTPYVHLTDHSGIGNPHLPADTDCAPVELFNDLLRRLIIADLRGEGMHAPPECNAPSGRRARHRWRADGGRRRFVLGAGVGTTLLTEKQDLGSVGWARLGYAFGPLELRAQLGVTRLDRAQPEPALARRGGPAAPAPERHARALIPGVALRYVITSWYGLRPFVGGGVEGLVVRDGGDTELHALVFSRLGVEIRRAVAGRELALGAQATTPLGMRHPDDDGARAPRLDLGAYVDVRF